MVYIQPELDGRERIQAEAYSNLAFLLGKMARDMGSLMRTDQVDPGNSNGVADARVL